MATEYRKQGLFVENNKSIWIYFINDCKLLFQIEKPDVLLNFVRHLHTILHQELKDPVLIWYDSVTVEGNLNWQNALNNKNK